MSSEGSQASALRSQIESRIQEIMSSLSSPESVSRDGSPVTIREIDNINRSAERERTALEFEQAKFDRMQLELKRLMALYEAVKTIEQDETDARNERQALLMEMADEEESDEEDTEDQGPTAIEMDQENLPRVVYINGAAGAFFVELETIDGNSRYYSVGEMTNDSFMVEDIAPSHVMLRGPASQQVFRVAPRGSTPPPAPPQGGQMPGGVIDLSRIPMAQF